jgi:hypothetical protein
MFSVGDRVISTLTISTLKIVFVSKIQSPIAHLTEIEVA